MPPNKPNDEDDEALAEDNDMLSQSADNPDQDTVPDDHPSNDSAVDSQELYDRGE
jgi:hypothetical protein